MIRNSFTWNEKEAKKEQPCYRQDLETGQMHLINAHTMDRSSQLDDLRKKLIATGAYSEAEIKSILKRTK